MGQISRDCDKDVTSEKVELTPLSERICGLKLVQIEPRSTSEKRIMLDYQLTVLLDKVVRTTFSENSEPV